MLLADPGAFPYLVQVKARGVRCCSRVAIERARRSGTWTPRSCPRTRHWASATVRLR